MDDMNWELASRGPGKDELSVDEILNEFKFDAPLPASNKQVKADDGETVSFTFGEQPTPPAHDDLPDLPTRHDDLPAADSAESLVPDEDMRESAGESPALDDIWGEPPASDELWEEPAEEAQADLYAASAERAASPSAPREEFPVEAAEAPLLQADEDAEDYLSLSDYEKQEEDPEIPAQLRRRDSASARKAGGLFGFLKRRKDPKPAYSLDPEEDAQGETAADAELFSVPEKNPAGIPDGDPTARDTDDSRFEEPSAPLPEDEGRLYPLHGGSVGKAEQEALSYIAALQNEAGSKRRDRRTSSDYRLDLEDLLGIDAADIPIPSPAAVETQTEEAVSVPDYPEADAASGSYTSAANEPEIDGRFNLGGQNTRKTIAYGDHEIDLSADEDYIPAQQTEYNPSQWTPDYDDPLAEREDTAEPPRKKHKFLFGRARKASEPAQAGEEAESAAAAEESPTADSAAPTPIYTYSTQADEASDFLAAPESMDDSDYDDVEFDTADSLGDSPKYKDSDLYVPPTFREYVLSILASVWLKLRGTVRGRTAETMSDIEEDLGPELSAAEASKYYGSFLRSMKLRVRISAVVLAVLCYITMEMPIAGMLKTLPVAAAFCFGLQAAIMLLALDVVTNGVANAFRLRFGADSLAVVSCLFTGIDALIVALSDTAAAHMPLCAVSSASVVGLLLASCLSARGLRKATRVPAIGKHFYAVTGENSLEPGEITLLKSLRSARGFVRRTEEAGPDETLFVRISPLLFAAALLFTVIVMVVKKSYPEFIYILSAMLCLTVPFGALLSFSLPFFLGSTRIFRFGAAIAGWSGLCDIGASKNLIVTDRDLFPPEAVSIESVRIFADEDAQKVISYAGSMMSTSGCCSAGCFEELMRETDSPMRQIDGFEVLPGGGMKGIIDSHVVLCGSTDLMRLMNVRIPFRLTDKTTVLLAIDGILYGIFSLKYENLPQVRKALADLVRAARPPVFAVRDFNVNPEMLHNTFDLATDGYDFPPYVERFRLSEPTDDAKDERIAAILCNEGLAPLTSVAYMGRGMYLSVRINVVLNLIASVLGLLFVFVRFLATGTNSAVSLLIFMLVCTLPVLLVSFSVNLRR